MLTIFTIFISIWPWSIYNLPEQRQLARLEANLIRANILQDWKIVPLKSSNDIDKNLSKEIYEWIDYLCGLNNCGSIKYLFPEQYKIAETENEKTRLIEFSWRSFPNKFVIVSSISKSIRVKSHSDFQNNYFPKYINLRINDGDIYPVDIRGYSKILKISESNNSSTLDNYAKIYINEKKIEVYENGKVTDNLDLKDIFQKLEISYKNSEQKNLSKKDMMFDINNYKIIFKEIPIKNPENITEDKDWYYSVEWFILVK